MRRRARRYVVGLCVVVVACLVVPAGALASARIVAGRVSGAGSLVAGTGWTVTSPSGGNYNVTFTTAFSNPPVVQCTNEQGSSGVCKLTAVSTTGFSAQLQNSTNAVAGGWAWSFIAIDPVTETHVATGDLSGYETTTHAAATYAGQSDARFPTTAEKAALDGAEAPSGSNPYVTRSAAEGIGSSSGGGSSSSGGACLNSSGDPTPCHVVVDSAPDANLSSATLAHQDSSITAAVADAMDHVDLVWWGVWFAAGLTLVVGIAPLFFRTWRFWETARA